MGLLGESPEPEMEDLRLMLCDPLRPASSRACDSGWCVTCPTCGMSRWVTPTGIMKGNWHVAGIASGEGGSEVERMARVETAAPTNFSRAQNERRGVCRRNWRPRTRSPVASVALN
ncbi:hypothetical protein NITHO_5160022 [Nitrolancea hollandica Lb]|uniref:Uncharacterized protein n=1 Tax=Nitrolancea hollandica Lb TaxID=1129897 RepID=I4ELL6_9BACT|nr:hypothetical protein NITHO_5160022 [Nitrolancea hollandica Lb]